MRTALDASPPPCSCGADGSLARAVSRRWRCADCRQAILYGKPKGRAIVTDLVTRFGERAVADAFARVRRYGA